MFFLSPFFSPVTFISVFHWFSKKKIGIVNYSKVISSSTTSLSISVSTSSFDPSDSPDSSDSGSTVDLHHLDSRSSVSSDSVLHEPEDSESLLDS